MFTSATPETSGDSDSELWWDDGWIRRGAMWKMASRLQSVRSMFSYSGISDIIFEWFLKAIITSFNLIMI